MGALTVVAWLGAQHPHERGERGVAQQQARQGWTLRYSLHADDATSLWVLQHLITHSEGRHQRGELLLTGDFAELAPAARRAGWRVRQVPGPATEPVRMEVFDRAGRLTWSGPYAEPDASLIGAALMEQAVVGALAEGAPAPAQVPIGCAPAFSP